MKTEKLFEHLCALETELHQPTVRLNQHRLNILLHDDFYEIGYSGKTYNKLGVLKLLAEEK